MIEQPYTNGHARGDGLNGIYLPPERDSGPPTRPPMSLEFAEQCQPGESSWIVKGVMPADGLMAIYGPSRAGKSFLALEWCLRIAHGDDVLGQRTRQVGVAYVGAEAANGLRKRIRAWLQEHDRQDDEAPFALIPRGVDFSSPDAPDLEELLALLTDAAIEFKERGGGLGIVVVDTVARATPGMDENSSADMGAFLSAMERIAEALGVLVVIVHHTGKDAARGARGHSSLFAALDTAIELQHDEEGGTRAIKVAKQKDDEDGRSWGFRLKPITIGVDSDGDEITSCVIEYTDTPQSKGTKRRKSPVSDASASVVLDALKAVLSTHGERPPAGVPAPAGQYAAPSALVRKRAYQIGLSTEGQSDSAKRTKWGRALQKLAAEHVVGVWEPDDGKDGWLWLK